MDEELSQRLFEEEQAQFEREQRIARERAAEQKSKDAALIEQIEDLDSWWKPLQQGRSSLQPREQQRLETDHQPELNSETS
ncbi:hypothetical protein Tco_0408958 [Tanacetum coccineum]